MNSRVFPISQRRGSPDGPTAAHSQRGDKKEMHWGFIFSLPLACAAVLLFSTHKRRAKRRRYLKQLKVALEFGDSQIARTRPQWLNSQ